MAFQRPKFNIPIGTTVEYHSPEYGRGKGKVIGYNPSLPGQDLEELYLILGRDNQEMVLTIEGIKRIGEQLSLI